MKTRGIVSVTALVLTLLAAPAPGQTGPCAPEPETGAGAPFGHFGGPLGGARVISGVAGMVGWAMAPTGVRHVVILVDGIAVQDANYGKNRPGLSDLFPGFPDGDNVGFGVRFDSTRFLNGLHAVSAKVIANDGSETRLNTHQIEFINTVHNLVPFGEIESPAENATLVGRCDLSNPDRFHSIFMGHALDAGVETGDMGVGWVEILVDGVIYANTRRDCRVLPAVGGLTDCYGLPWIETAKLFPTLRDAPNSGWRFALDVGELISSFGLVPGQHVVTIRAGDISGQAANIDEIPVFFSCLEAFPNIDSLGDFVVPPGLLSGIVLIEGWALDLEGVAEVQIFVDGVMVGVASHGFPRPLVTAMHPGFPESANPGWLFNLDTRMLTNGEHRMQVRVEDEPGQLTLIGERLFTVLNP